jgi:hypothetical protein
MSRARSLRWFCCGIFAAAFLLALCAVQGQDAEQADEAPAPQRGVRRGRAPTPAATDRDRPSADAARQSPSDLERAAAADARQQVDMSRNSRDVYRAAYASVQSLATSLEKHFRGVPGLSLVPEATSNSLLVSAPPEQFRELVDAIRKLDRVPKSAIIEVTILELPPAGGGKAVDAQDLHGSSVKIRAKVNELKTSGQIRQVRRFRMTALNNQATSLQANADKPAAGPLTPFPQAGRQGGGARIPNVGTTVQCTARIVPDGAAVLQLTIHDAPAALPAIGNEPPPPQGVASQFQGTLSIHLGTTVVAGEIETETDQGPSRIVILVAADVLQDPPE